MTRVRGRVKVGLRLGLGASESFIADCRYGIREDQVPVAGYRYTTL